MPRGLPTLALCSRQCGARCCRAPLVLGVTGDEFDAMLAARPDVEATHHGRTDVLYDFDTGGTTRRVILDFALEPGGACPFLDQATNECSVYEVRPDSCRQFPDRAEPWCLVWSEA